MTLALVLASGFGFASICNALQAHEAGAQESLVAWFDAWQESDRSITAEPVYYGEVFNNAHGGISTAGATSYLGLFELPLTLHLEKVHARLPGRVHLLGQNTHGSGITEDYVGDAQVLSNIDSFRNITQVSEYWWEFGMLNDRVTFRLGKQDVNTEFLFMEMASSFINSTFGLSPSTAFPTYPDPSLGVVILTQLNESWRLKTGVWEAFASGADWWFSGSDSVLAVGELEYSYALTNGSLPGVLAFGAVYESEGEIDGDPISEVKEYYVQCEQWLMLESASNRQDLQGLGVFAAFYPRVLGRFVPAESVGDSVAAGVIYTGLFPSRDRDVLGLGVAWTELYRGGTGEESAWELFYKAQLMQRVSVQADLQYISSPSGTERDSLVVGTRFQIALY